MMGLYKIMYTNHLQLTNKCPRDTVCNKFIWQMKFLGEWHKRLPKEWNSQVSEMRTGTKNGCGSGESQYMSTEGARRFQSLNLSGKRTEKSTREHIWCLLILVFVDSRAAGFSCLFIFLWYGGEKHVSEYWSYTLPICGKHEQLFIKLHFNCFIGGRRSLVFR